ncbi:MAG: 16S rRNA processing protein RimM [Acidobacteriota bacterium]|nr:MAG: 16S rRNA processing protein RimM [Acidobacteriota bacterium]
MSGGADKQWVVLARLRRPWGRRGELLVELQTDWPEQRFASGTALRISFPHGEQRTVTVENYRELGVGPLLKLAGVDDISAAEPLAGAWVVAARNELPRSEAGLQHADLPGLRVETKAGQLVGEVLDVEEGVAGDLIRVRLCRGGEVLVPLASAICPEIDPRAGRVVIDPPAGLLDPDDALVADQGPAAKGGRRER